MNARGEKSFISKKASLDLFFQGSQTANQSFNKYLINDFSKVMGVYPETKQGRDFYRDLYEDNFIENKNSLTVGGLNLDDESRIGSGNAASVFIHPNNPQIIIKVPHEEFDISKLQIEKLISDDLQRGYSTYGIRTLATDFLDESKTALVKPKIDERFLASNIDELSEIQKVKLRLIWENASNYARKNGVGLDLKADNLFWDESVGDWILIDTGARLSYLPFGYTLDVVRFDDFKNMEAV